MESSPSQPQNHRKREQLSKSKPPKYKNKFISEPQQKLQMKSQLLNQQYQESQTDSQFAITTPPRKKPSISNRKQQKQQNQDLHYQNQRDDNSGYMNYQQSRTTINQQPNHSEIGFISNVQMTKSIIQVSKSNLKKSQKESLNDNKQVKKQIPQNNQVYLHQELQNRRPSPRCIFVPASHFLSALQNQVGEKFRNSAQSQRNSLLLSPSHNGNSAESEKNCNKRLTGNDKVPNFVEVPEKKQMNRKSSKINIRTQSQSQQNDNQQQERQQEIKHSEKNSEDHRKDSKQNVSRRRSSSKKWKQNEKIQLTPNLKHRWQPKQQLTGEQIQQYIESQYRPLQLDYGKNISQSRISSHNSSQHSPVQHNQQNQRQSTNQANNIETSEHANISPLSYILQSIKIIKLLQEQNQEDDIDNLYYQRQIAIMTLSYLRDRKLHIDKKITQYQNKNNPGYNCRQQSYVQIPRTIKKHILPTGSIKAQKQKQKTNQRPRSRGNENISQSTRLIQSAHQDKQNKNVNLNHLNTNNNKQTLNINKSTSSTNLSNSINKIRQTRTTLLRLNSQSNKNIQQQRINKNAIIQNSKILSMPAMAQLKYNLNILDGNIERIKKMTENMSNVSAMNQIIDMGRQMDDLINFSQFNINLAKRHRQEIARKLRKCKYRLYRYKDMAPKVDTRLSEIMNLIVTQTQPWNKQDKQRVIQHVRQCYYQFYQNGEDISFQSQGQSQQRKGAHQQRIQQCQEEYHRQKWITLGSMQKQLKYLCLARKRMFNKQQVRGILMGFEFILKRLSQIKNQEPELQIQFFRQLAKYGNFSEQTIKLIEQNPSFLNLFTTIQQAINQLNKKISQVKSKQKMISDLILNNQENNKKQMELFQSQANDQCRMFLESIPGGDQLHHLLITQQNHPKSIQKLQNYFLDTFLYYLAVCIENKYQATLQIRIDKFLAKIASIADYFQERGCVLTDDFGKRFHQVIQNSKSISFFKIEQYFKSRDVVQI